MKQVELNIGDEVYQLDNDPIPNYRAYWCRHGRILDKYIEYNGMIMYEIDGGRFSRESLYTAKELAEIGATFSEVKFNGRFQECIKLNNKIYIL